MAHPVGSVCLISLLWHIFCIFVIQGIYLQKVRRCTARSGEVSRLDANVISLWSLTCASAVMLRYLVERHLTYLWIESLNGCNKAVSYQMQQWVRDWDRETPKWSLEKNNDVMLVPSSFNINLIHYYTTYWHYNGINKACAWDSWGPFY